MTEEITIMTNPLIQISSLDLAFIFSQLADSPSKVIWARSIDYNQQLYISPSYEKIWGRSCKQLYEYPLSWNETLATNEFDQVMRRIKARQTEETEKNTAYYCIHVPD